MDSQLTLVDHSLAAVLPDRLAQTVLTFNRDSLMNTTISFCGTNQAIYNVRTNNVGTRTEIVKVIPGSDAQVVVVRINRNDLLPDKIWFEGGVSVRTAKWLKNDTFYDPQQPSDCTSVRYVWKPTDAREIALYVSQSPCTRPIAWFRSSLSSTGEPASLSLQAETENIQDAVLASLLIVEQRYRVKHRRSAPIMRSRFTSMPVIPG